MCNFLCRVSCWWQGFCIVIWGVLAGQGCVDCLGCCNTYSDIRLEMLLSASCSPPHRLVINLPVVVIIWHTFLISTRIAYFATLLLSGLFRKKMFNMAPALAWDLKRYHIQINLVSFFLVPIFTLWRESIFFYRKNMIWMQDWLLLSRFFL